MMTQLISPNVVPYSLNILKYLCLIMLYHIIMTRLNQLKVICTPTQCKNIITYKLQTVCRQIPTAHFESHIRMLILPLFPDR